jgi:hypothetical protein
MLLEIIFRLGDGVMTIKEKHDNLLKHFFPHVQRAVDAITRLRPVHFAPSDLAWLGFAAIAELDVKKIPAQDYGYPIEGVAMPRCCLPW